MIATNWAEDLQVVLSTVNEYDLEEVLQRLNGALDQVAQLDEEQPDKDRAAELAEILANLWNTTLDFEKGFGSAKSIAYRAMLAVFELLEVDKLLLTDAIITWAKPRTLVFDQDAWEKALAEDVALKGAVSRYSRLQRARDAKVEDFLATKEMRDLQRRVEQAGAKVEEAQSAFYHEKESYPKASRR